MSPIVRYLSDLIRKLSREYGIIVWYDPDGSYTEILSRLSLEGIPLFRFEGSYLQLRHEIEPYLAEMQKPRLLIYVPVDRLKTRYALIEAEAAGCYLAPGHPRAEFNTSLGFIAQQVLQPLMPGDLENILRKIQAGEYSLTDVERLAESGYSAESGSLKLIYGRTDPLELLLAFMSLPEKDPELLRKNALAEIGKLVEQQLGLPVETEWDCVKLRDFLWRVVLINDFILTAKFEDSLPETISVDLLVPNRPAQKNVLALAEALRQRRNLHRFYEEKARQTEQQFALANLNLSLNQLKQCQTFPFVEKRIFDQVISAFLNETGEDLNRLVSERSKTFWGSFPPLNVQWEWADSLLQLSLSSREIIRELKAHRWTPGKLVDRYAQSVGGWHQLDGLFHRMDLLYHALDSETPGIDSAVEKAWVKGRRIYSHTLGELNRVFQESYLAREEDEHALLPQREIFARHLAPLLEGETRCAYILVDALRYDMVVTLQAMLSEAVDCQLQPVLAQLPTITPVGMAALLPGAERHLSLAVEKKRLAGVEMNGRLLRNREERIRFLEEHLEGVPFYETKLEKVYKPGKAVREAIKKARFILITSQEIDQLGEMLSPVAARRFMQDMLPDLRRAILELLKLGVSHVVVTSDHGYLFGEEIDPGEKIDPPGGETYLLHRRVWIGKGGQQHPAYLRLPESRVGLSGENELVFPAGIAAFKSPGGNQVYLHGGISLQEMVIPLLIVSAREKGSSAPAGGRVELSLEHEQITNRFFTVQVTYIADDLFAREQRRVKLVIEAEKSPVGRVVSAVYGYDSGSGEVVLEKDKPNAFTVHLEKEPPPESVNLQLVDAETGAVVARRTDLAVKFLI